MSKNDIAAMSATQKIELMEEIWDSLTDNDIESPLWHGDILIQREAMIESGEDRFVSLKEAKLRLQASINED